MLQEDNMLITEGNAFTGPNQLQQKYLALQSIYFAVNSNITGINLH